MSRRRLVNTKVGGNHEACGLSPQDVELRQWSGFVLLSRELVMRLIFLGVFHPGLTWHAGGP